MVSGTWGGKSRAFLGPESVWIPWWTEVHLLVDRSRSHDGEIEGRDDSRQDTELFWETERLGGQQVHLSKKNLCPVFESWVSTLFPILWYWEGGRGPRYPPDSSPWRPSSPEVDHFVGGFLGGNDYKEFSLINTRTVRFLMGPDRYK